MRIQQLAELTGVQADNIRYYEKAGLLPPPVRSDNNYRSYSREHARRLVLIRNCRALDMSLQEVGALLSFIDQPHGDCSHINESVASHLQHVRVRLAELQQLEKQLKALLERCTGRHDERDCAIALTLSDEAFSAGKGGRAARHSHVR